MRSALFILKEHDAQHRRMSCRRAGAHARLQIPCCLQGTRPGLVPPYRPVRANLRNFTKTLDATNSEERLTRLEKIAEEREAKGKT